MIVADILTVENLKAYYLGHGTKREVRAVDDVSLRVARNEIYGIAGESSSGKSSFIKVLAAATRPPLRVVGGNARFYFSDLSIDVAKATPRSKPFAGASSATSCRAR